MLIKNHRLYLNAQKPVAFVASPNKGGPLSACECLVIHYTASREATSAVNWLTNPAAKASAHLVIARDGAVTQLVPFDTVAWHAGKSAWKTRTGLNQYSLGIELANAGRLSKQGQRWTSGAGEKCTDAEVIVATHKNETTPCGWQAYTPIQIETVLDVALALKAAYGFQDVVGHDDIAPGRKSDPGPAFPFDSVRGRILGRNDDTTAAFKTTTELNIRSGPGTQHPTLPGSPLHPGTEVIVLTRSGSWCLVDVLNAPAPVTDLQGWVHGRFLADA